MHPLPQAQARMEPLLKDNAFQLLLIDIASAQCLRFVCWQVGIRAAKRQNPLLGISSNTEQPHKDDGWLLKLQLHYYRPIQTHCCDLLTFIFLSTLIFEILFSLTLGEIFTQSPRRVCSLARTTPRTLVSVGSRDEIRSGILTLCPY